MATTSRSALNAFSSAVTAGSIPSALVIRDVPDFIKYLDRVDTPLTRLLGTGEPGDIPTREWGWGSIRPRSDTLGAAITANNQTSLTVVNGTSFAVWDLIQCAGQSEIMQVTAISTNTLTVTRGFAGTTAASSVANSTKVNILGPAVPENVSTPISPVTRGQTDLNYYQQFEYSFQISAKAINTPTYEIRGNQYEAELKKKMIEAAIFFEQTLLLGNKNQGDGSGTNPPAMGGLLQYITTYTTAMAGAPVTEYDVMTQLQKVYQDVGRDMMGKTVMGSMTTKRIWNSWYNADRRATETDAEAKLTWDSVETDFGILKFFVNYNMPDGQLAVFNPEDCKIVPFAGCAWQDAPIATQGWFKQGALRGIYTAVWEGERRRASLTGFSTTATDYPALS